MPQILDLIAEARSAALASRFDTAAALANRALAASPTCLSALRILAWAQLELGDDRALGTFQQCAELEPEDALAWVGQAIWYQQRLDAAAAVERWVRAWELEPHNQAIRRALVALTGELPESPLADAIGMLRNGYLEEGMLMLRGVRSERQDAAIELALLSALSAIGLQREAFDMACGVHNRYPRSIKAALYVASIEDRAGRTLRSRELLARAEHADPGLTLFAEVVREVGLEPALDLHRASRTPAAVGR